MLRRPLCSHCINLHCFANRFGVYKITLHCFVSPNSSSKSTLQNVAACFRYYITFLQNFLTYFDAMKAVYKDSAEDYSPYTFVLNNPKLGSIGFPQQVFFVGGLNVICQWSIRSSSSAVRPGRLPPRYWSPASRRISFGRCSPYPPNRKNLRAKTEAKRTDVR